MRIYPLLLLSAGLAFCADLAPSSIPLADLNVAAPNSGALISTDIAASTLQGGLGPNIIPARSVRFAFADGNAFAAALADPNKTLNKLIASAMSKITQPNAAGAPWNMYVNAIECKPTADGLYQTLFAIIPVFEVQSVVYVTLGKPLRITITTRTPVELNSGKPVPIEPALNPGLAPKSFAGQLQDLLSQNKQFYILR